MTESYSKNCILMGDLDSFCLACGMYLPGDDEVFEHIIEPRHKTFIRLNPYIDKFKNDLVRKIRTTYFCEVCNLTFPTAIHVGIHVTGDTHYYHLRKPFKRSERRFKRVGRSIVFRNKFLISETAWNGFVAETCVMCDVDFEDNALHRYTMSHLLNIVRSTLVMDAANNIFRRIENGYQCLTCNVLLASTPDNNIKEHLNSSQHKNNFVIFDPNQKEVDDEVNIFKFKKLKPTEADINDICIPMKLMYMDMRQQ